MNRFIVKPNKTVKDIIGLNCGKAYKASSSDPFNVVVTDDKGNALYSIAGALKGDVFVNDLEPTFNDQGEIELKVGDIVMDDNGMVIVEGKFK